ncbi:hypothetical protein [Brevibacterium casei]|nr:hypothetical protein [Brevibacterium casei]MDH5148317.1 hypothetical protein [Brevibacterium casei]
MRYVAVAAPALLDRHGWTQREGSSGPFAEVDLASLPMVNFGRDDDLQLAFLKRNGIRQVPPMSVVPSSTEFATAVVAGVGWGMIPVLQLADIDAELVPITADPSVDVPLYWHHWKLASDKLSRLTEALTRAAAHMR